MGIEKFVVCRLNNSPAAISTVCLIMQIAGNNSNIEIDINEYLSVLSR